MWILDAHLDLSMNAMEWNRDLTRSVAEIRDREQGQTDKPDRGQGTVALPDMRRGKIGICVATQIARYVKPSNNLQGWYSPEQAWAQTQGQLSWYRAMEERGELLQIKNAEALNAHAELWANDPPADTPIGYILSLEGADSIITPERLECSYAQGLSALGPAHYGPGTYAQGTAHTGGLGSRGRELLQEMDRLGMILDATHLCDDSFWEAMDIFQGPVWASHNNCRALVPNDRQFSDEQIRCLIERGAVIGGVGCLDVGADWQRGLTTPKGIRCETRACDRSHGSHLPTGGECPAYRYWDGSGWRLWARAKSGDLDTIADLQRLPGMLAERGYAKADIAGDAREFPAFSERRLGLGNPRAHARLAYAFAILVSLFLSLSRPSGLNARKKNFRCGREKRRGKGMRRRIFQR